MKKKTTTCPKCGKENEYTAWNKIISNEDHEAKSRLLNGTLFNITCSSCGEKIDIDYELNYIDTDNQVTIFYVVDKGESEKKIAKKLERRASYKLSNYRRRIVLSQNALQEKVLVLEHGLDDRIIELIKLAYYMKVTQTDNNINIFKTTFYKKDDKFFFDLIGDNQNTCEVSLELYEAIKKDYANKLKQKGDNDPFINVGWAVAFSMGKKDD